MISTTLKKTHAFPLKLSCIDQCYQWVQLTAISWWSKKAHLFKSGPQRNQAFNQDVEQYAWQHCLG